MAKPNIVVAFTSSKICNNIINVLSRNGISHNYICKTGSSIRNICSYLENPIIICGDNFKDEPIYNIVEDFYKNCTFIIIGNTHQINMLDNKNCYKLSIPIKEEDFIAFLELSFYQNEENLKNVTTKYFNTAKKLLIQNVNFSEEKAHKYIQKKSMDTGKSTLEISKAIIKKYF